MTALLNCMRGLTFLFDYSHIFILFYLIFNYYLIIHIHNYLHVYIIVYVGIMEKESKRRTKHDNLRKAILKSVAVVGLLSVALVAPNALQVLKDLGIPINLRQNETINRSRKRLVEKGLLKYTKKGFLELTPAGEKELKKLELADFRVNIPRRWDKKWRVLSFDIHRSRTTRDGIRNTLRSIGFRKVHQSLWAYPYDCEDLVTLLKADFKIGKDLLYMIVDSIENDRELKSHFGLL